MNSENNEAEATAKVGTLYIVSTPIGNDDDISLRAMKILKLCDVVVCEEPKIGARFLHKMNLSQRMELLNEQNEHTQSIELIKMLKMGHDISLISDCGTPVFADPGLMLVREAIKQDIKIMVVPGASSIMTALVRSGFGISQFLYAGFLGRNREERFMQLERLAEESRTVILLETPYRMMPFLEAAANAMPDRQAYIGCNLTMPFETHHYGTFAELHNKFGELKFKGEFVVVFEGNPLKYGEEQVLKPTKKISLPEREHKQLFTKDRRDDDEQLERRAFTRKSEVKTGDLSERLSKRKKDDSEEEYHTKSIDRSSRRDSESEDTWSTSSSKPSREGRSSGISFGSREGRSSDRRTGSKEGRSSGRSYGSGDSGSSDRSSRPRDDRRDSGERSESSDGRSSDRSSRPRDDRRDSGERSESRGGRSFDRSSSPREGRREFGERSDSRGDRSSNRSSSPRDSRRDSGERSNSRGGRKPEGGRSGGTRSPGGRSSGARSSSGGPKGGSGRKFGGSSGRGNTGRPKTGGRKSSKY